MDGFFVFASVVLVLVTAAEMTFAWSTATGVVAVLAFAFEIAFRFGARDHLTGNYYLYRTGGAGPVAAMCVLAVLALWAAVIAYTTRNPALPSRKSGPAV